MFSDAYSCVSANNKLLYQTICFRITASSLVKGFDLIRIATQKIRIPKVAVLSLCDWSIVEHSEEPCLWGYQS